MRNLNVMLKTTDAIKHNNNNAIIHSNAHCLHNVFNSKDLALACAEILQRAENERNADFKTSLQVVQHASGFSNF